MTNNEYLQQQYREDMRSRNLISFNDWVAQRNPQPQRKPLTDEEKQAMWVRTKVYLTPKRSYFQGIADSEAAHGIKEKNT